MCVCVIIICSGGQLQRRRRLYDERGSLEKKTIPSLLVCVCVCVTGDGLIPLGQSQTWWHWLDNRRWISNAHVKQRQEEAHQKQSIQFVPVWLLCWLLQRPPFKDNSQVHMNMRGRKENDRVIEGKKKTLALPSPRLLFFSLIESVWENTKRKEKNYFLLLFFEDSTGRFVYDWVRGFCFRSPFAASELSGDWQRRLFLSLFHSLVPYQVKQQEGRLGAVRQDIYTHRHAHRLLTNSNSTHTVGDSSFSFLFFSISNFKQRICVSSGWLLAWQLEKNVTCWGCYVSRSQVVNIKIKYRQKKIRKRPVRYTCRCLAGICHNGACQARGNRRSSCDPRSPDVRVRKGHDTGRWADRDTRDCKLIKWKLSLCHIFKLFLSD